MTNISKTATNIEVVGDSYENRKKVSRNVSAKGSARSGVSRADSIDSVFSSNILSIRDQFTNIIQESPDIPKRKLSKRVSMLKNITIPKGIHPDKHGKEERKMSVLLTREYE